MFAIRRFGSTARCARLFFGACFMLGFLLFSRVSLAATSRIGISAIINESVVTTFDVGVRVQLFKILNAEKIKGYSEAQIMALVVKGMVTEQMKERYLQVLGVPEISDEELQGALAGNAAIKESISTIKKHPRYGILLQYFDVQVRSEFLWTSMMRARIVPSIKVEDSQVETMVTQSGGALGKDEARNRLVYMQANFMEQDLIEEVRKNSYIEIR